MKAEHKELAEKVIDFFKKSEKSTLSVRMDLLHILPDSNIGNRIIYSLKNDFGLIERMENGSFRLNDKGWKFTTFDKLEEDSKKTPLNLYQKIYLPFFIIFGLLGIYKVFQPTVPVSDFQELSRDFDFLNVELDSVKKQIELLPKQNLNDSLQPKNYPDVKVD